MLNSKRWRETEQGEVNSLLHLLLCVSFLTNLNVISSLAVGPLRAVKVRSVPWNYAAKERPPPVWKVTNSVSAADCSVSPAKVSLSQTIPHFTSLHWKVSNIQVLSLCLIHIRFLTFLSEYWRMKIPCNPPRVCSEYVENTDGQTEITTQPAKNVSAKQWPESDGDNWISPTPRTQPE